MCRQKRETDMIPNGRDTIGSRMRPTIWQIANQASPRIENNERRGAGRLDVLTESPPSLIGSKRRWLG